jgi:hypothetical protein
MYDPVSGSIAALHSGWRGTKLNIAGKGIRKMGDWFGSDPANILVWLSPCASGANYEVGNDVAEYFPEFVKKTNNDKYLLDIPAAVRSQLIEAGVEAVNIETSGICTIADERFHSYRRDGNRSGRMSAFIAMK